MVGFVENEHFGRRRASTGRCRDGRADARRRHQHVEAARQHVVLRTMRHAADDDADAWTKELAIGAETVGDLRREFARRRENQRARRVGRGTRA